MSKGNREKNLMLVHQGVLAIIPFLWLADLRSLDAWMPAPPSKRHSSRLMKQQGHDTESAVTETIGTANTVPSAINGGEIIRCTLNSLQTQIFFANASLN